MVFVAFVTQQYYFLGEVSILSGAVSAAAGDVARQAVANVDGNQHGFKAESVVMSAIGGGVGAGLDGVDLAADINDVAGSELLETGVQSGAKSFSNTVLQASLGNAVTQGVGVLTGLQDHFDWRNVAAAGAAAGAGYGVSSVLGNGTIGRIGSTFAAGVTSAAVRGGRIDVGAIARDAFGNALGNSLAEQASPTPAPAKSFSESIDRGPDWLQNWRAQNPDLPDNDVSSNNMGVPANDGGTWPEDDGNYPKGLRYRFLTGGPAAAGAAGTGINPQQQNANHYADYDLGSKNGIRQFLDDISYRRGIKDDVSADELKTAQTLLSSYYNINGSLNRALEKWDNLSATDASTRFDSIVNAYADYNIISDAAYANAAHQLGVKEAAVRAVAEVETKGLGFIAKDTPAILFERHYFSNLTDGEYDSKYPDISNPRAGGYGADGSHQYDRLNAAIQLNSDAALESASWGRFQIMGANYKQAGYSSVNDFVEAMKKDSNTQLAAFVTFVQNDSHLLSALRKQDWSRFARIYNGPNYSVNQYDTKMSQAYEKFSH